MRIVLFLFLFLLVLLHAYLGLVLCFFVRDIDVSVRRPTTYQHFQTRKKSSRDASNVCDGIGESDDRIVDDVVFVSFVEGRSDDALRKEASLFFLSGRNAKTTTDDHRCERNDDDDDGL